MIPSTASAIVCEEHNPHAIVRRESIICSLTKCQAEDSHYELVVSPNGIGEILVKLFMSKTHRLVNLKLYGDEWNGIFLGVVIIMVDTELQQGSIG
jgi:hypothetical protein